jgi:integrase
MTDDPPGKRKGARANREGKPWQRADGRWTVRVWPPAGVDRKPRYVYGRTRAEVARKREEVKAELAMGLPEDKDQTIGAYMTIWLTETLQQYVTAGQMAQSTLDSYRDNARKHIIPVTGPSLAHIRLRELTAPMVRDWQHRLSVKPNGRPRRKLRKGEAALPPPRPLSPRTVAYCHAILHKAIQDAVRDEVAGLQRNVVGLVHPPVDKDKEEIQPLDEDQAAALIGAMSEDRWWCYWLVALTTGFRRGEGLGMRWADLDLRERIWRPGESIQRIRGEVVNTRTGRREGRLVSKGLKTRASRKPVALAVAAVEGLEGWRLEQKKMRLASAVWADDLDLVFTTAIGTAIEPRNVNRQWGKVCKAAGVRPIRLHDLRHAFGSYLAAEKVAPKVIQRSMRHARFRTTAEIYLHAIEAVPREGADAIDRVYARLKAKS